MANTYRATSAYGKAVFGEDAFEGDFSVIEERDHLEGGHLEIVPRLYEVLSANYGPGQGKTFEGALPMENEAALIQGGHIERAKSAGTTTKKKG